MRITDEEYAAVCGSSKDEYAAVCGLQMKSMRHPAVRAVTYLRHYAFLPGLAIYSNYVILCYWITFEIHFI